MNIVDITPSNIRQFGDGENAEFCLVTNPEILDAFKLVEDGKYTRYRTIPFSKDDSFDDILNHRVGPKAHILVVSPYAFFQSPTPDKLGEQRKLIAMACNSTPTDFEAIAHFLKVLESSDPDAQEKFADRFFSLGSRSRYLRIIDSVNRTEARFDHQDESYFWSEQAGHIDYGQQQLAPPGEISVLPLRITDFDETLDLDINGTIALAGYPILHNGTPSFQREDQKRLHKDLATMRDGALIAHLSGGRIESLECPSESGRPAAQALEAMFKVDSRYRKIWEIGFAINTTHDMIPGNHAMNETYGGSAGTLHFGLGLTPYTQYHLDIICPLVQVLTDKDEVLIAGQSNIEKRAIARNTSAGCVCVEGA